MNIVCILFLLAAVYKNDEYIETDGVETAGVNMGKGNWIDLFRSRPSHYCQRTLLNKREKKILSLKLQQHVFIFLTFFFYIIVFSVFSIYFSLVCSCRPVIFSTKEMKQIICQHSSPAQQSFYYETFSLSVCCCCCLLCRSRLDSTLLSFFHTIISSLLSL